MQIVGLNSTFRQLFYAVFASIFIFLSVYYLLQINEEVYPVYIQYQQHPQIILDAGHGGMDGGAVASNGVVEKHINLSIVQKLNTLLQINGFDVILTRSSDDSIHDDEETTISGQKRSDMYNRMKIIQKYPHAVFVSIHQNMYNDITCKGTQVFYGTNHEQSENLASKLQNTFCQRLQPDNTRQIKAADNNLFLLYNSDIPAVMVECGFLSNPEECTQLCDDAYQRQIAYMIYLSLLDFYSEP